MTCRSSALAERVQCEADGRLGRCLKTASAPRIGHAVPLYEEPTDRAEWLRKRWEHGGLGASEVYRVLYGSPLSVQLEHRSRDESPPEEETINLIERGNDAEPHLLRLVGATKVGWVYRHPNHAVLTCTPDGVKPDGSIVECKYTSGWNREDVQRFADFGPMSVQGKYIFKCWVQCQAQWAVFGVPVELAIMIGGDSLADCLGGRDPDPRDIVRIPIERDELADHIEEQIPEYHRRFIAGDEDAPVGISNEDLRAAGERWCLEHGVIVERADLEHVAGAYVVDRDARLELAKREDESKRRLKQALLSSKAEVIRAGAWEVRVDARGTPKVTERRA